MDKSEICTLLRGGIFYAKHMINTFKEHDISLTCTDEHKEVIQYVENYIHKCQQIINDNDE